MTSSVDRNGPIPVYHQVAMGIERRIANGEWSIGDRLPSEVELARIYDVSRMTIRQALTELENDGIVIRNRPSGTFVARLPSKLAPTLSIPVSFIQSLSELGHTGDVVPRWTSVRESVPLEVADALGIDQHAQVVQIDRLMTVHQVPIARVRSIVPSSICPGLEELPLTNNSIHATIEAHFGISIVRADHWIEAVMSSDDDVEILNANPGTPILTLTSVYKDAQDVPIEHVVTHWLADVMQLHLQTTKTSFLNLQH